jgi:SPP1 family predicted phage head-tail adaptor
MRSGALNKQIVIETLGTTQSTASGEILKSWSTTTETVWADFERIDGGEQYMGEERQLVENARFRVRYSSTITQTNRISYNSKYWEIMDVENVGDRNKELIITARSIE